jgi:hypothetical protein
MSRYSIIVVDSSFGIWDSSYREPVRYGRGERKGLPLAYDTRAKAAEECSAMNEIEREKED